MLTADLVDVRRRGDELYLRALGEEERADALAFAEAYVGLVRAHLGRTRAQLAEAFRLLPVPAHRRKLAAGLGKLALDECEFEEARGLEPAKVRSDLFAAAAAHRRQLAPGHDFDRAIVLAQVAAQNASSTAALEEALYADLPEAQVLIKSTLPGPRALLAAYEAAGVQAVLLRAVRVKVEVLGAAPAAYRQLFRKLKFLRLLHQIEALPAPKSRPRKTDGPRGYEIAIDGPFSMFESVTRYGLQLAMAFPAIAACGQFRLEAELRWGKERRPFRFVARGEAPTETPAAGEPALPPELATLLADLEALADSPFAAAASTELVALPGLGVIAPDLELVHQRSGRKVLLELLGFWSRDAVWRRIEMSDQGLPTPTIFAVSKHLRVSEAALPDESNAALYVYAHKLSARAIVDRAKALLARPVVTPQL